jgi:hypothetical protein
MITIRQNAAKFLQTGSVKDRDRSGRPTVKNDHVHAVAELLVQGTSTRTTASVEGEMEYSKLFSFV